jgi:hypothetical protein
MSMTRNAPSNIRGSAVSNSKPVSKSGGVRKSADFSLYVTVEENGEKANKRLTGMFFDKAGPKGKQYSGSDKESGVKYKLFANEDGTFALYARQGGEEKGTRICMLSEREAKNSGLKYHSGKSEGGEYYSLFRNTPNR